MISNALDFVAMIGCHTHTACSVFSCCKYIDMDANQANGCCIDEQPHHLPCCNACDQKALHNKQGTKLGMWSLPLVPSWSLSVVPFFQTAFEESCILYRAGVSREPKGLALEVAATQFPPHIFPLCPVCVPA